MQIGLAGILYYALALALPAIYGPAFFEFVCIAALTVLKVSPAPYHAMYYSPPLLIPPYWVLAPTILVATLTML